MVMLIVGSSGTGCSGSVDCGSSGTAGDGGVTVGDGDDDDDVDDGLRAALKNV